MKTEITRRQFLKGAGTVILSAAFGGILSGCTTDYSKVLVLVDVEDDAFESGTKVGRVISATEQAIGLYQSEGSK